MEYGFYNVRTGINMFKDMLDRFGTGLNIYDINDLFKSEDYKNYIKNNRVKESKEEKEISHIKDQIKLKIEKLKENSK